MNERLNRKAFVTTLGAAGLGLGLTAAGSGPGAALAKGQATPAADFGNSGDAGAERGTGPLDERLQLRGQFYTDFTTALADALQRTSQGGLQPSQSGVQPGQSGQGGMQGGTMPTGVDVVDAAIRNALMAMIDAWQSNGRMTYGQAEALKTLIATSPAPIGPGPLGLVLFGSAEGAMHPGGEGMAGGMHGGGMEGSMHGGTMPPWPAGKEGGARRPGQEGRGGRHGRESRERDRVKMASTP